MAREIAQSILCLVGLFLLGMPFPAVAFPAYHVRELPGTSSSMVAFSSGLHDSNRCINQCISPMLGRVGLYTVRDGLRMKRGSNLLASVSTSRDETLTADGSDSTSAANDIEAPLSSKSDTGSTAIILNINARSVTPALRSIAAEIVGEENVFVTKTFEDATLAARSVVRGFESVTNGGSADDENNLRKYSLVVPVGGDGTLSGWINTLVDEILLFHKLENETMSVEEALEHLPMVGYIPMGTGNGLGYVVGCKPGSKSSNDDDEKVAKSLLSRVNVFTLMKRKKQELFRQVVTRLKDVGDAVQKAEQMKQRENIADVLAGKCSVVEMPLMEVTHPSDSTTSSEDKGDLCFFAGAGFDSLMLHDFQQIKAWSKSSTRAPSFVKDALSSVAGYCVALVTKTLPQTLKHGTHKIHVEVTTKDEDTLWVDHRRGDFSELAVQDGKRGNNSTHLIYSGETGIIAAATTPYYGGGMRLFPYARLVPDKLQLRLGRISPLTGFLNIPSIFAGSYRETGERTFGCLDFIGKDFEVEVRSGKYEEYVKRKADQKKRRRARLLWWRQKSKDDDATDNDDKQDIESDNEQVGRGFPFQHSGESMGCKERFRLRVVQEPVKFVSFLEPRVVVDE